MISFPCAKINLGLNVVERRSDGYHNLETVFLPVPVTDALEIHEMSSQFPIDTSCSLKVTGSNELFEEKCNLVYKAYTLLSHDYNLPRLFVHLHKCIPSQAGMGGGSSDAAYMIRMLNEYCSLGLSVEQMRSYASCIGADCAFFITSDFTNPQPMYATGIGDKLQPLMLDRWTALDGKWLALVKPLCAVSTKEAYAGITPRKPIANCRDVLLQPLDTWKELLVNDFEEGIFAKLPALATVKQELYNSGAVYAAMSGSGSTLYGIFDSKPSLPEHVITDAYTKIIQFPMS